MSHRWASRSIMMRAEYTGHDIPRGVYMHNVGTEYRCADCGAIGELRMSHIRAIRPE